MGASKGDRARHAPFVWLVNAISTILDVQRVCALILENIRYGPYVGSPLWDLDSSAISLLFYCAW
jgi:hypothetical protein